jgi:hypothetical protein
LVISNNKIIIVVTAAATTTTTTTTTISWSRVLHEKPLATQMGKEFLTFYGTQRFITVFTRALRSSLS